MLGPRGAWRVLSSISRPSSFIVLFAFVVLFSVSYKSNSHSRKFDLRDLQPPAECHNVYSANDQCSFVHQKCSDEDSGPISYLELYFCSPRKPRWLILISLLIWLGMLFSTMATAAGDFLCINLGSMVVAFGMSETLAGVTVFAFGNGSSDLFSTFAAMSSNSGSLAIGELFGAAVFITTVIVGVIAIIQPYQVIPKSFARDIIFFVIATIAVVIAMFDGKLKLYECVLIMGLYVFYVIFVMAWHWTIHRQLQKKADLADDFQSNVESQALLQQDAETTDPDIDKITPPESGPLLAGPNQDSEVGSIGDDELDDRPPPRKPSECEVAPSQSERHISTEPEESQSPPSPPEDFSLFSQTIIPVFFPFIAEWKENSFLGRVLAILSMPGVVLLVLTVPTAEPAHLGEEASRPEGSSNDLQVLTIDRGMVHDASNTNSRQGEPASNTTTSPNTWKRWLVCIQILLGPLFLVWYIYYTISSTINPEVLIIVLSISAIISLLLMTILLYTSSPNHAPSFTLTALSVLGFFVSVAWISLIASEVVTVLESLGVIGGISDALLGLTIFAVGNSCNDLVADVAIARSGRPILALSACLGGPMLNILLGIGIGGLFMNLNMRKPFGEEGGIGQRGPYTIDVGASLYISAGTLLFALIAMLVAVALNGWRMDRKIGWSLIALWIISTTVNVVLELQEVGTE